MDRFFVNKEDIKNNNVEITKDDAKHISKVLRLKVGNNIEICDKENNEYICEIIETKAMTKAPISALYRKHQIEPIMTRDPYQINNARLAKNKTATHRF